MLSVYDWLRLHNPLVVVPRVSAPHHPRNEKSEQDVGFPSLTVRRPSVQVPSIHIESSMIENVTVVAALRQLNINIAIYGSNHPGDATSQYEMSSYYSTDGLRASPLGLCTGLESHSFFLNINIPCNQLFLFSPWSWKFPSLKHGSQHTRILA